MPSFGGTSYWVRGPDNLDADLKRRAAYRPDVLIKRLREIARRFADHNRFRESRLLDRLTTAHRRIVNVLPILYHQNHPALHPRIRRSKPGTRNFIGKPQAGPGGGQGKGPHGIQGQ